MQRFERRLKFFVLALLLLPATYFGVGYLKCKSPLDYDIYVSGADVSGDYFTEEEDINEFKVTDALETLEARSSSRKAIFFIETSRRGTINPRQMCAIESAAKNNPFSDVYLLLLDPPVNSSLMNNEQLKFVVRFYKNLKIVQTTSESYFAGTALQTLGRNGKIGQSNYPVEHMSDVMRILTILRFGGIYFDLDVMILRSLETLAENWVSFETEDACSSSAFGFQKGQKLAQKMAVELNRNFDGDEWGNNGPGLFTRMLKRECEISAKSKTSEKCPDITVLPPSVFHSIEYLSWQLFFDRTALSQVYSKVKDSLGVHLWNHFSHEGVVIIGSNQPYGYFAQKHCPRAYWSCNQIF
ncbi:lactosylceramide 4-alpha-galactosyltransferase-like [Neocloeon triangulifer]|uniref:lactosylceramide 4-alpha-galactosyltransferase-like n=1 Tax=Neocloeon triangulifer TaxID=2078957 RepID=UPI00286F84E2|nr:lactosylceramide 4-alpha-galactosyltransferase-like [Neocloeon triangulifer]